MNTVYNQHAIFFSPSLAEGWALPPAEAMAAGCALVCTQIGGHADYAFTNETALLVEPKNIQDMVHKLRRLLNDKLMRIQLAERGHEFITKHFSSRDFNIGNLLGFEEK